MSKLKNNAKNLYDYVVGTVSGGAGWLTYLSVMTAGPTVSHVGSKILHQKGYLRSEKATFITGVGIYTYLANSVKIKHCAKQASKKIERIVEKSLFVDYFISPDHDAYGVFDTLDDISREIKSTFHSKYQTAVATASKVVYIASYASAWVASAITAGVATNILINTANKFAGNHQHIPIFKIDQPKNIGAMVVTFAIAVANNPEIHSLAKDFAKSCELVAEELLGVSGDPAGLLDGIVDL